MVVALNLFAVLFEGIGVGMALPMLEYIRAGGDTGGLADQSRFWRWMLDGAVAVGLPITLITLMGSAFAVVLMRQAFIYARDLFTSWVHYELMRRLRNSGFHHFVHAQLSYHDHVDAGAFVNEMTTETQTAVGVMASAADFIGTMLLILGYWVIAFTLSPLLTIIAALVLLGVALVLARLMNRIRALGAHVTQANQQMSIFLVQRLKAIRLVRLSGVEAAEEMTLRSRTLQQRDRLFDRRKMLALLGVLIEPMVLAVAFVLLYVAVSELALPIETILLFFFILLRLVPIVKSAIVQRQGYLSELASVEIVHDRIEALAAARDLAGGNRALTELKSGIHFEDVTFSYSDQAAGQEQVALNHVSLDIPASKMTAIVGPSGAGKSTLVDLLPRLRAPQSGHILYDGVPQSEFSSAELRKAISFAPQSPQIFNVTAADHIRYGKPGATMDEIVAAARLAQADEFICRLPQGYDTLLGEGGARLSGGQRQRLDLARALVRGAPILVLDEPTANLDAEAEGRFRTVLDEVLSKRNLTVVIIGHRLSTLGSAARIIVLKEGRVAEVGTHSSLMAVGGWYARAFAQQHSRVAVAAAS